MKKLRIDESIERLNSIKSVKRGIAFLIMLWAQQEAEELFSLMSISNPIDLAILSKIEKIHADISTLMDCIAVPEGSALIETEAGADFASLWEETARMKKETLEDRVLKAKTHSVGFWILACKYQYFAQMQSEAVITLLQQEAEKSESSSPINTT